ncbi:uncharacterized protein [Triticum aestivum]|uniref:uncharacterized protein n=1 Tax=Triticum aestivum TaxID=4565 RepID=UPI001D02A891|nr:uncharacterized protein LOC123066206 [Triticum aestivum]
MEASRWTPASSLRAPELVDARRRTCFTRPERRCDQVRPGATRPLLPFLGSLQRPPASMLVLVRDRSSRPCLPRCRLLAGTSPSATTSCRLLEASSLFCLVIVQFAFGPDLDRISSAPPLWSRIRSVPVRPRAAKSRRRSAYNRQVSSPPLLCFLTDRGRRPC